MLLRGIAFAEARRNSARRVFKSRDKTQGNGCERDAASDLAHDGSLASAHVRTMMVYEPLLPVFPILSEGEAISLIATASKLATVEDVGPKRPEGPIRPSAASLKVSPTARATLQALRSKSKLVTSPVSTRDAETITANFADSGRRYLDEENGKAESSASAGREIMYLGTREARRPKGPAKLKEILEKREAVLSKWRDDVCSGEELPEVEIISLLEEQIPRYRLRADTLTQFQGYENADWFIPAPALKSEDVDLKLSPDQIRETLNYFILCSNRVSQMTKTYNDIEAVTRLLEEKEKDLELTARIGKELLAHNQKLETTVNALEAELKEANEKITQLNHEMLKKTELINILTNDVDESSSEAGTPTGLRGINLDTLQRKVTCLEDENKQLRNEFAKLMHDTDSTEEQETRLVQDIAAQLANANLEVDGIAEELGRQKDENRLQHEQIISLTAKLAETELRLAQLMAEHDDVGATLVITRDNQNTLAAELAEFKERYAEVVNLLAETQEQLRKQRKRGMPTVRGGSLFPSMGAAPQPDSIASELESSLYSELSIDSGIGAGDRIPPYKKVFETVRSASRATYAGMDPNQFPRIGSMNTSTLSSSSVGPRMSCGQVRPQASTFPSLDSTGHSESDGSLLMETDDYPGPQRMGVPGAPGAADLEAAIRRLTPAEVLARRACLSTGAGYSYDYDGGILHSPPNFLPFDCRTPDSIMSTGSSGNLSGFSGNSGNAWRIPQKLQIVKPMEGSQTLHHWSRLATPTLGGLLEDRPGVKTRGGRALEDLGLITFALSDLEEDEEYTNPGKPFQDTGSIYTFTNSTVMHPDDHTTSSVTPSIVSSRVASAPNSGMNSGMSTPRTHSRRNSTSTFSTTLGLAKMLNERGIKAVTPSCIGTPTDERNFSPTATPCNSPDASLSPRSSSPPPESGASLTLGLLSTGAELLRRTFSYEPPAPMQVKKKRPKSTISRSDKKALTGIRLVEKIERIGIDTIIATTTSSSISPLALQGALYTRRSTGSPMAQLTFLKTSMSSSTSQEKLISPSSSASSTSDEFPSSKPPSLLGKRANSQEPQPSVSGSNAFNSRAAGQSPDRQRRSGAKATRPDLGRVKPPAPTPVTKESKQSALGAISSLLFGRKGGLL